MTNRWFKLEVDKGMEGLWYIRSPDIPGLLVACKTISELGHKLESALSGLSSGGSVICEKILEANGPADKYREFAPGDIVVLKSGGPEMTVRVVTRLTTEIGVGERCVVTQWIDRNDTAQTGIFVEEQLRLMTGASEDE